MSLVAIVADDGRGSVLPLLQQKIRAWRHGSRLPYYKVPPIRIRDFLTASDAAFFCTGLLRKVLREDATLASLSSLLPSSLSTYPWSDMCSCAREKNGARRTRLLKDSLLLRVSTLKSSFECGPCWRQRLFLSSGKTISQCEYK